MTPSEIALVQQSWAKVAPMADQAADAFYDRLFEVAPGVRSLFPAEMSKQKRALMGILNTAVQSLDNLEAVIPAVQQLGVRHIGYGALPEHYDVVGACLLDTLEKGLGGDFTPETKAAWTKLYTAVAGVMKEAAAKAQADGSAPPVRPPPEAAPLADEGPISAAQKELVKASWAKVAPIADTAADIFYNRLFEVAPGVRPLFPADMAKQKRALMGMLATAVGGLDDLGAIVPAVQAMGLRHVGYGALPEHYDVVGACLLDTLEKGLGEHFTPATKEAWTVTYGVLAGVMKEAAAAAQADGTAPAVREPPGKPAKVKPKGFFGALRSVFAS